MQRLKTSRYRTVAVSVKLWKEISKVVEASGAYTSEAEFIRDAVRDKLQQFAVSEARDVDREELERLIVGYIEERSVAYPSDVAADLRVPYFTVVEVINRLVQKGVLEPAVGGSE